jgi:hypothetical protein
MVLVHPKLLPTEFLKVEVSTEAGGNDIEHHLQPKALRGDRMNRLRSQLCDQAPRCFHLVLQGAIESMAP